MIEIFLPRVALFSWQKNLEIARKCGMEEVVLYRLGGLDRYCDVIKKFI